MDSERDGLFRVKTEEQSLLPEQRGVPLYCQENKPIPAETLAAGSGWESLLFLLFLHLPPENKTCVVVLLDGPSVGVFGSEIKMATSRAPELWFADEPRPPQRACICLQ